MGTEGEYKMGKEGKHLPKQKNTWSLTLTTPPSKPRRSTGTKRTPRKTSSFAPASGAAEVGCPWAQLGDYNQDYHNNKCGARGKVGPACHRDAVVFTKPE